MTTQCSLFAGDQLLPMPPRMQLLKWIGNKQRFAREITSYFPKQFGTYFEPFLGSGAVLATLAPERAIASDVFAPLMEIWRTLHDDPEKLKDWYGNRWEEMQAGDKVEVYEQVKRRYNAQPNGADLLFLSRTCYGGVVRFRKRDGHMSTPCGPHTPIRPKTFAARVDLWHHRTQGAKFEHLDYREAIALAGSGDIVYCDPPYSDTQGILYGAQSFRLADLLKSIAAAKERGAFVALSIDGTKRSGNHVCDVAIPRGLFEREVPIDVGRSMLKRFQMGGRSLEKHVVSDRLLLTHQADAVVPGTSA